MKTLSQPKTTLAVVLFAIGALIGIGLSTLATWADLEAAYYGFPKRANSPFGGLSCPILMTKSETGVVTMTVSNPTDRKIFPIAAIRISTPILPEGENIPLELAPGGSRRLEWKVSSENIDLNEFIFVYALVYASYPIPDQDNTCGIFVVDAPVSGMTILVALIVLYALFMGVGLFLLDRSNAPRKKIQPFFFLGVSILLLLITSFSGAWVFAVLLLAVTILALLVTWAFWMQNTA